MIDLTWLYALIAQAASAAPTVWSDVGEKLGVAGIIAAVALLWRIDRRVGHVESVLLDPQRGLVRDVNELKQWRQNLGPSDVGRYAPPASETL